MANVPAIVSKRLISAVPKFKKILLKAKECDVNESDTVTIITDMLEDVFGFDKYSDITREYAIQGTYCDLAVKCGKGVEYLIEVKAIGLSLKDNHLKQAVNYASREGIKWVVLTNGLVWEIHRVTLNGKVENEKICTLDFENLSPKKEVDQEQLFLLCKRGIQKDAINDFFEYKQSVNRYTIGAVLVSEPVISTIRRELRKLKDGIKVDPQEIIDALQHDVIKREVLDSESAKEAQKLVTKVFKQQERAKAKLREKSKG